MTESVTFNQRSIAGILQRIRMPGGPICRGAAAHALATRLNQGGTRYERAARLPHRPRVFVEEWTTR